MTNDSRRIAVKIYLFKMLGHVVFFHPARYSIRQTDIVPLHNPASIAYSSRYGLRKIYPKRRYYFSLNNTLESEKQ